MSHYRYVYASNGIDLEEVRQHSGSTSYLLAKYAYNSQHLPLTVKDAAVQQTTMVYNSAGQVRTVTNPLSEVTTFDYDTYGYLETVTGPMSGATMGYTYDAAGRVATTTDSDGHVISYAYDDFDRITTVTYPDTTTEERSYDKLDVDSSTDRLGRTTFYHHDALRHMTSVIDPLVRQTMFDYCTCGRMLSMEDARGQVTSWDYDVQGRVTKKTFEDATDLDYVYETTTSRLKTTTDAKGQVQTRTYAVDDNLLQVTYSGSTPATPTATFSYDPVFNRISAMENGSGTTTSYAYYPVTTGTGTLGATRLKSIDGPRADDLIELHYDELGRALSYAVGQTLVTTSVTADYDTLGRIEQVQNTLGTFDYDFDGVTGRMMEITFPNNQTTAFTYLGNTDGHRLESITHKSSSSATITGFDYVTEANGRVEEMSVFGESTSRVFGYDAADQLSSFTPPGISAQTYFYGYDAAGNRNKQGTSLSSPDITSTYDDVNELVGQSGSVSRTLTYDDNGNLMADGTRTFEWDAANRMTAIVAGTHRSEFSYDAVGRRVKLVEKESGVAQSEARYVWLGSTIIQELNKYDEVVRTHEQQGFADAGRASHFYLRNANSAGSADLSFDYDVNASGQVPVVGHWYGTGAETVGLYDPALGQWSLRNANSAGTPTTQFVFGPTSSTRKPISGDWNFDGTTTIGLYDDSTNTFYLRNTNSTGAADLTFKFGTGTGKIPLAGDWDGNGTTTIGLYDVANRTFLLRNTNSAGAANITLNFGSAAAGLLPIVGDWDGDGDDTVGFVDPATGTFKLRNTNSVGAADVTFIYDVTLKSYTAIVGDWDGNNSTTPGYYRAKVAQAKYFYLRDHLSSVRTVTNDSGAVVATYDYGPWGEADPGSNTIESPIGYAGYWVHEPSDLSLTWYREYDPVIGRWLSRDPIGEDGGTNLYGYVANSPLNATDPSGLLPFYSAGGYVYNNSSKCLLLARDLNHLEQLLNGGPGVKFAILPAGEGTGGLSAFHDYDYVHDGVSWIKVSNLTYNFFSDAPYPELGTRFWGLSQTQFYVSALGAARLGDSPGNMAVRASVSYTSWIAKYGPHREDNSPRSDRYLPTDGAGRTDDGLRIRNGFPVPAALVDAAKNCGCDYSAP